MVEKKVLIADDQFDTRQLLQDILEAFEPYGVKIMTAVSGDVAYEMACNEHPDLILLDVMMPGLSGYEVCQKLKEDPATQDMYIIMVSARFQSDDRTQAALVGADEYITKPYAVSLIMERVQAILGVDPL